MGASLLEYSTLTQHMVRCILAWKIGSAKGINKAATYNHVCLFRRNILTQVVNGMETDDEVESVSIPVPVRGP